MVLGKYIVSTHAKKRYEERVGTYSKMDTLQCIKQDLHFTRIKKIVRKDNLIHVFGRHSLEFVFVEKNNVLVLKTVIKRTRDTNKRSINKRQKK